MQVIMYWTAERSYSVRDSIVARGLQHARFRERTNGHG